MKKFGEEEILQEDFVTQRDGRFVVPLRVENKRAVDGIIHGVSATGQTVFLEPAETYEMNNELSLLAGREQREIIRILTTLTAEIGSISHLIEGAFHVMTELDTVLARARYAVDLGGLKPRIVKEPLVELRGVHHPVLKEQARQTRLKTGTEPEVVPLDVRLDASTRGLLISGPNAGGKTVAMKTIGVSLGDGPMWDLPTRRVHNICTPTLRCNRRPSIDRLEPINVFIADHPTYATCCHSVTTKLSC